MRDKVRALYYPDFVPDQITLIKAILLFDEIHFMDRPSFTFYLDDDRRTLPATPPAGFGLIGASSPLRRYEASFRENGVPLYVHGAPGGPISGELLDSVRADVLDRKFLLQLQEGLRSSDRFLELHVPNAMYGGGETQESIANKLVKVDLANFSNPLDVYLDAKLRPFEFSTDEHVVKALVMHALSCSAKMNFALSVGSKEGFSPLADAVPFSWLLATKYRRAVGAVSERAAIKVPLTELSLAILDELVPAERLHGLTLGDVVKYRRASEKAREEFMEHLSTFETQLSVVSADQDYGELIKRVIDSDVKPAARKFKNAMTSIYENLFGSLVKRAVIAVAAGAASTQVFGDMSWAQLCAMSSLSAGTLIADKAIDAFLETRKLRRECSLSYLLDVGAKGNVRQ